MLNNSAVTQSPKALIIGSSGQTGAYLAESLSARGFTIIGTSNAREIDPEIKKYFDVVHNLDIRHQDSVTEILRKEIPDYIFNFAGLSSVMECDKNPELSREINFLGVENILRAIVASQNPQRKKPLFVQASSSEMFSGELSVKGIDEKTPINPGSVYGQDKADAQDLIFNFANEFGFPALSLILFNHESRRRQPKFLSRKVTKAVKEIATGQKRSLKLGNLDVGRDWGYAPDYAEAIALAAEANLTGKLVVAMNQLNSVRDFVKIAFEHAKLDYRNFIEIDNTLVRKNERPGIFGIHRKLVEELGWKATYDFDGLVGKLVSDEFATR